MTERVRIAASFVVAAACAAGGVTALGNCQPQGKCEVGAFAYNPRDPPPGWVPPSNPRPGGLYPDFPESGFLSVNGDDIWWESAPEMGSYKDFSGLSTYAFTLPAPMKQPFEVYLYVSPDGDAGRLDNGTYARDYTSAAGNIGEITIFNDAPAHFQVHNESCAQYYVRVVAHSYSLGQQDAGAPPVDAASDGDAASDADAGVAADASDG